MPCVVALPLPAIGRHAWLARVRSEEFGWAFVVEARDAHRFPAPALARVVVERLAHALTPDNPEAQHRAVALLLVLDVRVIDQDPYREACCEPGHFAPAEAAGPVDEDEAILERLSGTLTPGEMDSPTLRLPGG